ncbi:uncharacterized protein LOC127139346, partial [Lates calcarifer]|uniref:ribonuclease H n=1 Tax=Lates calcarifer TaxID=8187 RepID=A0AAJ8AYW0_LATCA
MSVNMDLVEEFLKVPTEELLERCSREQLVRIAEHFKMDVGDKRLKENMRNILKENLLEVGVLSQQIPAVAPGLDSFGVAASGEARGSTVLTFEQQRELLLLQMEMKKLELEERRLTLSNVSGMRQLPGGIAGPSHGFDVSMNLRLVPQFCERDPDTFFSLFERVAESRDWSDAERTLLLQCVLTGKAQEAYSALSVAESKVYVSVKTAVLKAYELVPEAYRQKFRSWEKSGRQTHMEFARELVTHFNRWCTSLGVHTYEALCDLVVLEQFKNSLPSNIATFVAEHKVKTAAEAAALADEYVLTHRVDHEHRARDEFGFRGDGNRFRPVGKRWEETAGPRHTTPEKAVCSQGYYDAGKRCNYCKGRGHWKNECPAKAGSKGGFSNAKVKPVALAAPVRYSSPVESPGSISSRVISPRSVSLSPFPSDTQVEIAVNCSPGHRDFSAFCVRWPCVTGGGVMISLCGDSSYAQREAEPEAEQSDTEGNEAPSVSIPDSLLSVSRSDLAQEQSSDLSLRELFHMVLPGAKGKSAARGYFLQDQLLVIQSDQGSNFSSHLFAQVLRQLRVKHNQASAYHAQSQGALERFHQTLKSLLPTFQRLMNMVVSGLSGCAVYLDDVVVYSDTWEDHVLRIRQLFDRLRDAHLTVNLAKCEFAKATVTYLGKVVGQGQVRPVRAKLQVDASDVGAGAVLIQLDDNSVERPVSFFSRKFNSHQLNYSVIEKETLALAPGLLGCSVDSGGVGSEIIPGL